MTAPLHPGTFARRPQSFGRRSDSIAKLRARVNRRAELIQAARDLAALLAIPLLIGGALIGL